MSTGEQGRGEGLQLDRRSFLQALGAAGFVVVGGGFASRMVEFSEYNAPEKVQAFAMFVDLDKCDGCGECSQACIDSHHLGKSREPGWKGEDIQTRWLRIYEMKGPTGEKYFMPVMCQNCQKAPCVDVCPTGASFYSEFDVTLVDPKRCIGCRTCMAACPYQVRIFNWKEPDKIGPPGWEYGDPAPNPPPMSRGHRNDKGERMSDFTWKMDTHYRGRVEKCDFCLHNAYIGALPHCVSGCPMGALYYGDLKEDAVTNGNGQTLLVSETARHRTLFHLKEERGTETRVYYMAKGGGSGE